MPRPTASSTLTLPSLKYIDSGTSVLWLAGDVYAAIVGSLKQIDPAFGTAIEKFTASATLSQGMPTSELDLAKGPDIHFVLEGLYGKDIRLTCTPQTCWQVGYPAFRQGAF